MTVGSYGGGHDGRHRQSYKKSRSVTVKSHTPAFQWRFFEENVRTRQQGWVGICPTDKVSVCSFACLFTRASCLLRSWGGYGFDVLPAPSVRLATVPLSCLLRRWSWLRFLSVLRCLLPLPRGYFTSQVEPDISRSSTQWILLCAFTSSTCRSTARS